MCVNWGVSLVNEWETEMRIIGGGGGGVVGHPTAMVVVLGWGWGPGFLPPPPNPFIYFGSFCVYWGRNCCNFAFGGNNKRFY